MEVSREQIGLADGAEEQAANAAGPLWKSIPAVAQGRAHAIPDDIWYLGIGPIAANLVLEDLATYAPPVG